MCLEALQPSEVAEGEPLVVPGKVLMLQLEAAVAEVRVTLQLGLLDGEHRVKEIMEAPVVLTLVEAVEAVEAQARQVLRLRSMEEMVARVSFLTFQEVLFIMQAVGEASVVLV